MAPSRTVQTEACRSKTESLSQGDYIKRRLEASMFILGIVKTEKKMLWAQPKPCMHRAWVQFSSHPFI